MAGTGRARRTVLWVVLTLAVLLVLGALGGSWYFADQLTRAPDDYYPYAEDNEVVAVDGDLVTVLADDFSTLPGTWGLQLADGHLELTDLVDSDDQTATWRFTGDDTPEVGDPAKIDEYVTPGDPRTATGLPYEDLVVAGPLGDLPAWWVPADGEPVGTVVFVHGRAATREEANRFLPAIVASGWNVMVVTYRGDEGAPPFQDGRVRFGRQEWQDVAAALDHDAVAASDRVVLFGVSMGGMLVAQTMDRSPLAAGVDAVVLDSPILSMDDLLVLQGELNGVPGPLRPVLLPVVQVIADVLYGLDSPSLEQAEDDATFDLPVLLFHGEDDRFVPDTASVRLAAVDDDVQFEPFANAGHVRSFNVDHERYEAVLTEFLAGIE